MFSKSELENFCGGVDNQSQEGEPKQFPVSETGDSIPISPTLCKAGIAGE